jgi:hypothetical protein
MNLTFKYTGLQIFAGGLASEASLYLTFCLVHFSFSLGRNDINGSKSALSHGEDTNDDISTQISGLEKGRLLLARFSV